MQVSADAVLGKLTHVSLLCTDISTCRSQQGASGVQTIRLTPEDLRPGTIFFAFFNVDYFVHQRYSFIFLVSCLMLHSSFGSMELECSSQSFLSALSQPAHLRHFAKLQLEVSDL